MLTLPTVDDVARALLEYWQIIDWSEFDAPEDATVDVRLQIYPDGDWAVRCGDPCYDLDHHGHWGASCLSAEDTELTIRETAERLIEECAEDMAMDAEHVTP